MVLAEQGLAIDKISLNFAIYKCSYTYLVTQIITFVYPWNFSQMQLFSLYRLHHCLHVLGTAFKILAGVP